MGIHGAGNILHSTDVNPLDYSLATIRGDGLRDDDITKAFAKMIHRKIERKKSSDDDQRTSHVSFENLVDQLDEYEPMKEIYNVIAMSLNPSCKKMIMALPSFLLCKEIKFGLFQDIGNSF